MDPLTALRRHGPMAAKDLRALTGQSPSALQRALKGRQELLVVGRARATRYAVRRVIEGVLTPIPIYEMDATGEVRAALTLHPVEPMGCYVEGLLPGIASGFHETDPWRPRPDEHTDLPWFLMDLKPTGFLGRTWQRDHPDLPYPRDLHRWTGDHVLRFLTRYGAEAPGAFLVGTFSRDQSRDQLRPPPLAQDQEVAGLEDLATQALRRMPRGSSLGGEQPKFPVRIATPRGEVHHLVKFSPPLDTPGGQRWADLLTAEWWRGRGDEELEPADPHPRHTRKGQLERARAGGVA